MVEEISVYYKKRPTYTLRHEVGWSKRPTCPVFRHEEGTEGWSKRPTYITKETYMSCVATGLPSSCPLQLV